MYIDLAKSISIITSQCLSTYLSIYQIGIVLFCFKIPFLFKYLVCFMINILVLYLSRFPTLWLQSVTMMITTDLQDYWQLQLSGYLIPLHNKSDSSFIDKMFYKINYKLQIIKLSVILVTPHFKKYMTFIQTGLF